jgi:hypothetical protein
LLEGAGVISAIQTHYAGCHFRSRLEARWAVFFDALGIKWEYEKEGFTNGSDYYLPDFYLPDTKTWVEVKGDPDALKRDNEKMWRLHDYGGVLPNFSTDSTKMNTVGLVLLGGIPYPESSHMTIIEHPIIQHDHGLMRAWCGFLEKDFFPDGHGRLFIADTFEFYSDGDSNIWDINPRVRYSNSPLHHLYSINNAYLDARAKRFEFE